MESDMILSPLEQLRIALGEQTQVKMHVPVNHSLQDISNAVASVMNYLLTDAFDLTQEESFWVGYELQTLLSPVSALVPRMYLAAVKQELNTNEYSEKMFSRNWDEAGNVQTEQNNSSKQAPISDWAEMLSEIVLVSYPDLRSFIAASVIGSIYGILAELGLTEDLKTTRKSLYLPTAIRHLVGLQD
jgi:hypothetical protein